MNDKNKTKAQLISELQQLRRQVAELATAATDQTGNASFLTMAEAAASAIFVFRDSVFLYANPATAKLTGYSVEELIGRNIWTLVHPEFLDRNERVLAFQRGEAVSPKSEFKIVTKRGETRWLNADATITEFGGSPAVLTIAYDSTEYKLAQKALKTSEEQYRNILETAQEAIWIVDPAAKTTYVNDGLAQMLGYEPEEMLGHSVFDFVDPADHHETRQYLERGRHGFKERIDYRFRRKDGSHIWTMLSTTPLFDIAGEFIGGLAMLIDITERRRSEEALRRSEERLRTYIEQANDLIFILDSSGRLTSVNKAVCNTTGYAMEELVGRMALDFVVPEQRIAAAKTLQSILKGAPVEQSEFDILSKDGRRISIEVRGRALHDGGQISGIFQIARDITERKKTERALKQSEALLYAAIDNLPFELSVRDQNGRCVIQNPYSVLQWGDQIGNRLEQMATDAAPLDLWRGYHQRALGHEVVKAEFEIESGDQAGYYYGIVAPVRVDSEVTGVLGVNIDITDRKRAEQALTESEERFRALAESTAAAIFIYRGDKLLYVNPATKVHTGYDAGELLSLSFWDVIHPDYRNIVEARALARQRGEAVPDRYEFKIITKSGEVRWIDATASLLEYEGQTAAIGTAFDITAHKRAEDELRRAQDKLHHVLVSSPAVIYSLKVDGSMLTLDWISESLTRLTGYEVEEAFSDTWRVDHIHPDDRIQVVETMPLLFVADRLVLEYRFQHRQKGYVWLHDEIRLLRDDSGNPIEAIGSWVDVTQRREAEAALRESEERFRKLVSSIKDTVFTLDREHRITGMFGSSVNGPDLEPEEFIGKTASELFGIEGGLIHHQAAARALAGEQVTYEWSLVYNKNTLHYQTSLSPMRNESGEVTGLVGVARDITERKLAEEALHASEERYRDLVENARDIIYSHDLNGNYTSVNKAVEQITGYTREEALTLNFAHTVAPEYIETARQMIAAKLAGQKETVYDLEIIAKDGRRITIEVNTRVVRQNNIPIGIQGIARDVTKRKRMERALRESQSRLQSIMDNCPAMIFEKDLDGRYLQINRQFERTFDLVSAQVLGRTDDDLFPQALAAGFRATDRRVIETGHASELEESAVYADGLHHYIVHKFPLHDVAGDMYGVGGISTEITARKRAEEELKRQKEILQKIFDHIPVMIRFLDEEGHIKLVNREWERAFGWTQNELTANNLEIFSELYPDPEYRQRVMDFIAESTGEFVDFKTRARDGRVIDTRFANVRLEDGTKIGIGRDITEIKQAEEALRRQTAQLAALHEIGLEISAESDLSRILEVVTHRASELLGAKHCSTYIRDPGEGVLKLVASIEPKFVGLRVAEGEGLAGRALLTGNALIIDDYSAWRGRARALETEGFGPSIAAPLRWQESAIGSISLSRDRGEPPFTARDTSLLKQLAAQAAIAIHQATLFDELQESRARLQVLSHRLIDAQEAERKRLARELHDQIGQALTAIQISLQAASSAPDGGTASIVEDCLSIIDESLELVHDLSFDLRPSLLDDLGLGAALRWYVERATSRADLIARLNVDALGSRFSSEVETACFRIAQESLTNVVRHASARTVSVTLVHREDCLKLMVQDDGVGFDVHEALGRKGSSTCLGLQGMRERASALGGIVEIKSSGGGGTEIEASFPLRSAGKSES